MDVKFSKDKYMRRMNGDDNAVDREREVAITCSICRRFHNIRLLRCRTLLSYFRFLISLTETFSFGWSSSLASSASPSFPSYTPDRS